jgi:hypothetical protein
LRARFALRVTYASVCVGWVVYACALWQRLQGTGWVEPSAYLLTSPTCPGHPGHRPPRPTPALHADCCYIDNEGASPSTPHFVRTCYGLCGPSTRCLVSFELRSSKVGAGSWATAAARGTHPYVELCSLKFIITIY